MDSVLQGDDDAFAESQKQSWLGSLAMDGTQVWAHSSNTSLHGFGCDGAKSFLFLLVLITEHCPKMQRNKLICFYATYNLYNFLFFKVNSHKEINHKNKQFNF